MINSLYIIILLQFLSICDMMFYISQVTLW